MTSLSIRAAPPPQVPPPQAPPPQAPFRAPPPRQGDLDLPADLAELEAWIVAVVRAAGPARLAEALAAAEAVAAERFPARDVVRAMRRALTVHLTEGLSQRG
ncbi:hypothetical protein [Rhizomonospora bruguierae]|uniref:hypothetical protein n=1 Tax=Rhizomonospora bruguierae TaxID=1581705 RepID=UPI0020BD7AF1|nr:hypothetical protein [Micromonospora sp. NBRC 107566]